MLRKFVSAVVVVVMLAGLAHAAKDKKAGKKRKPHGRVVKVEGEKLTVAMGKKGAKTEKTFTLKKDTKFVTGKRKNKKELTPEEGRKQLTAGVRVRLDAGADGMVNTVHIGSAKKAKKTKLDKKG
jgi:hypothetical protein